MVDIDELTARIAAYGCGKLHRDSKEAGQRIPYKTLRNIVRGKTSAPRLDTVNAILKIIDGPRKRKGN